MDLVIDANILFAALIKESKTHNLLFDERLRLFCTEFLFTESEKYAKLIKDKSSRTESELNEVIQIIKRRIILVPSEELLPYLHEAERVCPDPDDVAYFALAIKLRCPLWSNDRALREQQKTIVVHSTEEVIQMIEGNHKHNGEQNEGGDPREA